MLKAMVYDFDGTLTPTTMPEFEILEKSGLKGGAANPKFFATAHEMAREQGIDIYDAMIRVILDVVKQGGFRLTDEKIGLGADRRTYNPGVEEFLAGLKERGVRNYLLSSGSQAYLKQLTIAPCFEEIYASVLAYDEQGEVTGIVRVMSADEKSVALQEIAEQVNGSPVDFSGIVYVGDGPTDVVAMNYIKQHGGGAILIQHAELDENLPQVNASIVDLVTGPDYAEGSELAKYVTRLLEL